MQCEVVRKIQGQREFQPGEIVDVSDWKLADQLLDQGRLRLVRDVKENKSKESIESIESKENAPEPKVEVEAATPKKKRGRKKKNA